MASPVQNKSQPQPRQGLIRKILNLLSIAVPHSKSPRSETKENVSAKSNGRVHSRHTNSSTQKASASAAEPGTRKSHSKSRRRPQKNMRAQQSKHKNELKAEHSTRNPHDVIPESPRDPAHSPGHRKLEIEKDLH